MQAGITLLLLAFVPTFLSTGLALAMVALAVALCLAAGLQALARTAVAIALAGTVASYIFAERFAESPLDAALAGLFLAAAVAASAVAAHRSRGLATEVARRFGQVQELRREGRIEEALQAGDRGNVLAHELRRSQRYGHELAVAVLVVDNLELHRERLGLAAEEAMVELARMFGQAARVADLGMVIDGHIVLVMPETDQLGGRRVVERLRLGFSGLQLVGADEVPLTASAGVAAYPGDGSSVHELLAACRGALARATELGGNRTVVASVDAGLPPGWAGAS